MRKILSIITATLLLFSVWSCGTQTAPAEEEVSDSVDVIVNPLLGCWSSLEDSTVSQLCIFEDSLFFTDLLMNYPYYTKGDSLIVNSLDGDAFIRWRYLRRNDTLMLFQHPQDSPEEYVVLMTPSSE